MATAANKPQPAMQPAMRTASFLTRCRLNTRTTCETLRQTSVSSSAVARLDVPLDGGSYSGGVDLLKHIWLNLQTRNLTSCLCHCYVLAVLVARSYSNALRCL